MAIKLLRAKKDIFWEDSLPDEKPFCTKDTWYEVISSSKECLTFKNDRGDEHPWMISEVDEDFCTIDFEKGFEFINTFGDQIEVLGGKFSNLTDNFTGSVIENFFISTIVKGTYKILRYSNQKKTPPKKVKPSKEERPYENWKMSISKDKFIRCIEPEEMVFETVEGLVGWLNKETNMFYYKVKSEEFLSAKVYPFNYPDSTIGYEFVKENKDAKGYRPKSKPITEDKYEFCPENIWDNFDWENTPIANSSCDHNSPSILDVVESTRKGILASFGVPKDSLGQEDVYSTELKFNLPECNIVEGSESLEEKFKTEWSDKHYDFNYTYSLTEEDIEKGKVVIKIDPYFVNDLWKLNKKDSTGIIFHNLKTLARWCDKNPEEREIRALHGQIKRLAEMKGVILE